jgi:hypothetical protein
MSVARSDLTQADLFRVHTRAGHKRTGQENRTKEQDKRTVIKSFI